MKAKQLIYLITFFVTYVIERSVYAQPLINSLFWGAVGVCIAVVVLYLISLAGRLFNLEDEVYLLRTELREFTAPLDENDPDLLNKLKKRFPGAEINELQIDPDGVNNGKKDKKPNLIDDYLNHPEIKSILKMAKDQMKDVESGSLNPSETNGTYLQQIEELETTVKDLSTTNDNLLEVITEKNKTIENIQASNDATINILREKIQDLEVALTTANAENLRLNSIVNKKF